MIPDKTLILDCLFKDETYKWCPNRNSRDLNFRAQIQLIYVTVALHQYLLIFGVKLQKE